MNSLSTTLATHGWWLAARASGLVALALVTASVGLGLTMAGKVTRRPGLGRRLMAAHEHTALAGLIAIAVHGITLLGDPWLKPGLSGVTVPFSIGLPAAVHRAGDHRRLPRCPARAQLLRSPPDRRPPLAQGPSADGRRLCPRRRPHDRRRHRRVDPVDALVAARHRAADRRPLRDPPRRGAQGIPRRLPARRRRSAAHRFRRRHDEGPRRADSRRRPGGPALRREPCVAAATSLPIRIVCAEPEAPYDRPPLSKQVLAGSMEPGELAYRSPDWYAENEVELLLGRTAPQLSTRRTGR